MQSAKIEKAIETLAQRENDYEAACKEYAEAEHAYRMAKASAFLTADGTVEHRKFTADKQCWNQMKTKLAAEAVMSITKERLLDCRQVISARQSILSAESRNQLATERFTT